MATVPIRPGYERMQWATGPEAEAQLRAWQQGQTGFPLVDAGVFVYVCCCESAGVYVLVFVCVCAMCVTWGLRAFLTIRGW